MLGKFIVNLTVKYGLTFLSLVTVSENEVNAEWLKKLFFIMLSAVHNRKCKAAVLCLSVSPVFFLILMQLWVTSRVMTWWSCFSHFSPFSHLWFTYVLFKMFFICLFQCLTARDVSGVQIRIWMLLESNNFRQIRQIYGLVYVGFGLTICCKKLFFMSGDFLYNIKRRMGPGYVVRFAVIACQIHVGIWRI